MNDPLGGCCVTPSGYSMMLSKLMQFARGKIVLALEGWYNLVSLENSALACVETLLDDKPISGSLEDNPFESTWRVIQEVRKQLSSFWPILAETFPQDVTHERTSPVLNEGSDTSTRPSTPASPTGMVVPNSLSWCKARKIECKRKQAVESNELPARTPPAKRLSTVCSKSKGEPAASGVETTPPIIGDIEAESETIDLISKIEAACKAMRLDLCNMMSADEEYLQSRKKAHKWMQARLLAMKYYCQHLEGEVDRFRAKEVLEESKRTDLETKVNELEDENTLIKEELEILRASQLEKMKIATAKAKEEGYAEGRVAGFALSQAEYRGSESFQALVKEKLSEYQQLEEQAHAKVVEERKRKHLEKKVNELEKAVDHLTEKTPNFSTEMLSEENRRNYHKEAWKRCCQKGQDLGLF